MLGKTDHRPDLDAAWSAADLIKTPTEYLASANPAQRYWGVLGLKQEWLREGGKGDLPEQVLDHLDDASPAVRIETAAWIAEQTAPSTRENPLRKAALARLTSELEHDDWAVALRACRAIELLGEKAADLKPTMKQLYSRTRHAKGDNNFFIAFSAGAYLDKLGEETDPWDFTPGAGSFMPPKKKNSPANP